MYSSPRSSWSRWSDRKPYASRGESFDRPARTFDRKPYAGKPRTDRPDTRWARTERGLDPRQMRYQVIGRTTDESDLIVQISPAFYEYVRSMAHQWVKAPRVEESRYNDRREDRSEEKPRYTKFDHPYHKDPLTTSYNKEERLSREDKRWVKASYQPKPKNIESWDADDIDVHAIDAEMDDEYQMIKQWFANLNKNNTKPKRTVRSNNVKKK
jgi:hypothetical protein